MQEELKNTLDFPSSCLKSSKGREKTQSTSSKRTTRPTSLSKTSRNPTNPTQNGYEEILVSKLLETLDHDQMKFKIKGQDTFEHIINELMNHWEELSAEKIQLFIEYLIYFIQSEPIQKNKSQIQVVFTLFTFLNEWENSIHSKNLKNNAVRLQWIKFCYVLLENQALHAEFELFQIEFIIKFLQSSLEAIKRDPVVEQMKIQSVSARAEGQLEYLIHFYSFKLARYLFLFYKQQKSAFDKNLENSFKNLFHFFVFYFLQLKFIEFLKVKNELIYFPSDESFFNAISQAILFSTELPGEFIEHFLSVSSATHVIVKDIFHLLNFPHLFVQKAAFYLLSHVFRYSSSDSIQYLLFPSPPSLSLSSSSSLSFIDLINCDDFHIDKFLPEYLLNIFLLDINHLFSSFLDDPSIHYSFRILSSLSFNYLLAIYLLCIYYSKLNTDTKRNFSYALKNSKIINNTLEYVFAYINKYSPSTLPDRRLNLMGYDGSTSSNNQFISDIYFILLSTFPSLVRQWWNDDCNRQLSASVENYTTKYISQELISSECATIKAFSSDSDEFIVKANPLTRQVEAIYIEDEVQLGINLNLPNSYPLRSVEVTCKKKIGVKEAQWRQWILSMHTLLLTQDASILDAVLLWKNSMDKLFEGVESCLICFSVLQMSNNSLPRLACKTCKNKFHSACLYKWFNTSHKSNCPHCQTPWME